MKASLKAAVSWTVLAACAVTAAPAWSQEGAGASEVETVIVTARKRDETDISVPVSITAMSAAQIERNAIFDLYDIAQRTPTLQVSTTGSGVGGTVFLRGVGSAVTTGNSVDQSISFDLDGVPVSRGNMLRVGEFDLDQIQIMKGPQALFFGKNSPGGVIAFRSKDPTDEFEVMTKLAYEPFANTRFGEFALSGPITDTLKARLFTRFAKTDGDKKNIAAEALPGNLLRPNTVFAPSDDRGWSFKDKFVRGTVLWEPNDKLTVRLKASYDMLDSDGVAQVKERFYCAQGKAQLLPVVVTPAANGGLGLNGNPAAATALANVLAVDDCKLNGKIAKGNINPAAFLTNTTFSRDPNGAAKSRIVLASAEVNYALADHIDLTSVSGFNRISENNYDNLNYGVATAPISNFNTLLLNRQFTQELRLRTSFESPFNAMVGGFYQKARLVTFTDQFSLLPANLFEQTIPNEVWSGFGQVTWDITDQLELAAGARYTEEKKSFNVTRDGVPQVVATPNVKFTDTSPEATLTWRPSGDLTAYLAYKTGFKSGGYATTLSGNGATLPTTPPAGPRDFSFQPESAEGFEVGLKAQVLERSLRIDTTVYSYEYTDLQLSNVDSSTGVPILRVLNAAGAKQKGIDIEASYYPPAVSGLRLNGGVNYNRMKYSEFNAPCFVGQSIAEGCNVNPRLVNGVFSNFQQQDLSGRRAVNAPLWVGSVGFTYRRPLSSGLTFEIGGDTLYKSSYNVTPELVPGGFQKSATYFNAQIRFMNEKQGWEFGIFAKNLTDKRRATEYSPGFLTGNCAALTAAGSCPAPVTGTVNGSLAARQDLNGNSNPGRTVMFQLTLRPSMWVD